MVYASLTLLLILSTGYVYHRAHKIKCYTIRRREGKFISLYLTVWGFFIALGSYLSVRGLLEINEWAAQLGIWPDITNRIESTLTYFLVPNISTTSSLEYEVILGGLTPIIGAIILAVARNIAINKKYKLGYEYALPSMDTMERMLTASQVNSENVNESADDDKYFRVVLKNGKVYIGNVLAPDIENGAISHLEMVPMFSGFLNQYTKKLVLTENYSAHYLTEVIDSGDDELAKKIHEVSIDYKVTIPVDEIVTASFFNYENYQKMRTSNVSL